jgi:hypothetical protein
LKIRWLPFQTISCASAITILIDRAYELQPLFLEDQNEELSMYNEQRRQRIIWAHEHYEIKAEVSDNDLICWVEERVKNWLANQAQKTKTLICCWLRDPPGAAPVRPRH